MKMLNGAIYSVNAAALLLGAAGLLSRLLGIFRDRMLAAHFGAGRELDLYYAAFQIPDFMMMIFILGAGSAAILPIFQEYLVKDREGARRLISHLSTFFTVGALAALALTFIFAPFVVSLIAPGFSSEERALTATLTRIMLLSPLFFGLSSILSAAVQSFQRFISYALAPVLYNVGIIIGIVVLVPFLGVKGLAVGVVLGSLLHFGIQFVAARDIGFAPKFLWGGVSDGVREVVRLSFPRVLSLSLSQLTMMALVALGSTLEKGSIAIFQLAQNLYMLPIGIFGISYAIAIFPRLSRSFIERKAGDFFEELFLGIRSILFWVVPSLVIFVVLRAHIVRVALGAGEFSWEDTRLTAAVLAILSVSMFATALISLFMKGFYALENTWRPFIINIFASALTIVLALLFTYGVSWHSRAAIFITSLLRIDDLPDTRVVGLALSFLTGSLLNVFLLYGALKKLAVKVFGEDLDFPAASIFKIIAAALGGGAVTYILRASFSETLPLITFGQVFWQGAISALAGFAVYFGILFVWHEESVYSLWRTLRSRLFKIGILPPSWDGEIHGRA